MTTAGVALAVAGAGMAIPSHAAVDPGHVVLVSKDDSIVIAEGFLVGDPVTVEVLRNDIVIGQSSGVAEDLLNNGVGAFEVNHAADPTVCWEGVTPEILAGDVVRVTSGTVPEIVDTVTISDIEVTEGPTMVSPTVGTVKGVVNETPRPPIEEISVETRGLGTPRFRGFAPGASDGVTGTIAYDDATSGAFTATFSGFNDQQRGVFLDSFEVAATHMANPELENEGTVAVLDAVAGSEDPLCPPAARRAVTQLSKSSVNVANMATPLAVSGVSANATAVNVTVGDSAGGSANAEAALTGTGVSQTWTASFTADQINALADGTLTVSATYTEAGGDLTGVTKTLPKDTTAPTAAPVFTPGSRTFVGSQQVSLAAGAGDSIKYTLDGSAPSASNGRSYTGPFTLTTTATVRAIAIDAAGNTGPTSQARYVRATVASAPGIGTATSGALGRPLTATARWTAPSNNGGAGITGYQITAQRMASGAVVGTVVVSAPASARALSIRLASGRYRFQVRAVNAVGRSAPSAFSNTVAAR